MTITLPISNKMRNGTKDNTTKLGIGWRPQLALEIKRLTQLDFIEITAEEICIGCAIPRPVQDLIESNLEVIVHSTSLSIGGAELPSDKNIACVCQVSHKTGAMLVSDHVAFVRDCVYESGHLLPIERSYEMLDIMVDNVRNVRDAINAPFALENIASLFEWPHAEMNEAQFITKLLNRTDTYLLLDVSNLYANSVNHSFDALEYIDQLPLDRLAYVHIAGGKSVNGVYHDTHSGAIPKGALRLLKALAQRTSVPRVMIEIDDQFPDQAELQWQLDLVSQAVEL